MKGTPVDTIWSDISPIQAKSKEGTGYPTQKPLALLERIISASSNAGDVVLDPFCGCATACVAAEKLGRKWVGIDISSKAGELVNMRLREFMGGLFHSRLVTARTDIPRRTDIDDSYSVPEAEARAVWSAGGEVCGVQDGVFVQDHGGGPRGAEESGRDGPPGESSAAVPELQSDQGG